ncbi:hypothetical protein LSAT2_012606, partial [Lamellibrachia satsuma]
VPCGGGERTRKAGVNEETIRCNTQTCEPRDGDCIGDVVFVLDSSGSIGFSNWAVSLQFVIDIMKGLKVKRSLTHVSIVTYSTEEVLNFDLNQYSSMADIEPIVFGIEYLAGVTNTADGIKRMHEVLKDGGRGADKATPIAIVITDGVSNVDESRTIPEAKLAQDDGIQMFAVAIGDDINRDEIKGIATNEDYVFEASDFSTVQDLTEEIAARVCGVGNRRVCGPCKDYGQCSETCGAEGMKEGIKECWLVNGLTGLEIRRSRHDVPCNDTCEIPCPTEECGRCGNYGSCSESCGADGTKQGTKDCWLNDGVTGMEIDGSRHEVPCSDTCFNKCPIRRCGPCGDYGSCSESCGAEGTKEGTKDCWLEDADTGEEIVDSRHDVPCSDTCEKPCPTEECGRCGDYGSCSESCGADGTKQGTKDCWLNDGVTGMEIDGSRHEVPCSATCFYECPWEPDCSRCDYTKGQIWLQDRNNCHMYYICEPLGNGEYRIHRATCGDLFWNQAYHTCVPVMPADVDCKVGPVSEYVQPSTPFAACPYDPYPGDSSKYWIRGDALTLMECVSGMEFENRYGLCDCLPVSQIEPTCADNLLLHFPYEDHYNDVTCHHAIATKYGEGVSIRYDSDRRGNVACFTGDFLLGEFTKTNESRISETSRTCAVVTTAITTPVVPFMRTWFANNKVNQFTVTVWFKRRQEDGSPQGIVNNADCLQTAGFLIGHMEQKVVGHITTERKHEDIRSSEVVRNEWHHVAWVYDGNSLKIYVDNVLEERTQVQGYLMNNDVPMYIANCCGEKFFVGCLDELRVYDRVLSANEIRNLP